MGFEQPNLEQPENNKVIELTSEEFDILRNFQKSDDPERLKIMKDKGISFDSGEIKISVDGREMEMTTRKDDFGTTIDKNEPDIPSGY